MGKRATENKNRWNAKTYARVLFCWRRDDTDVCRMMESVPSRNGYLMSLVKRDIEERKKDGRWASMDGSKDGSDGDSDKNI